LHEKIKRRFSKPAPAPDALNILLLDLSQFFSSENENKMLYDVVEPPLGLICILTYLNSKMGPNVNGKIAKSRIDFDNYRELKELLNEFKPDVIGVRSLTYYKDFFHKTIALIRQWGIEVPIITGGPYATSDYKTILQDRNIDVAVLGEGEITFSEVIEKIIGNGNKLPGAETLSRIPGIAFFPAENSRPNEFARQIIMMDELEDRMSERSGENPQYPCRADDLAYVIFTSGSTGRPKGVMVEHKALNNLCHWHNTYYSVTPGDRAVKYAGFEFDASVWEIFPYLIAGTRLYILNEEMKLDIDRLNRYFEENRITIGFLPTQMCEQFMQFDNRSLRVLLTGGDKLNNFRKQDYRLANNYGPTENAVVTSAFWVEKNYHNIPIGKPIFNTRIYIIDQYGNMQPIGVPGELSISGSSLARGYVGNGDKTGEKFIENPFMKGGRIYKTGDLARWLSDGNVEFLGRVDYQVKIRGFRIEAGEIESQLLKTGKIK
jgi:amino acid adenylation domain-containing protein